MSEQKKSKGSGESPYDAERSNYLRKLASTAVGEVNKSNDYKAKSRHHLMLAGRLLKDLLPEEFQFALRVMKEQLGAAWNHMTETRLTNAAKPGTVALDKQVYQFNASDEVEIDPVRTKDYRNWVIRVKKAQQANVLQSPAKAKQSFFEENKYDPCSLFQKHYERGGLSCTPDEAVTLTNFDQTAAEPVIAASLAEPYLVAQAAIATDLAEPNLEPAAELTAELTAEPTVALAGPPVFANPLLRACRFAGSYADGESGGDDDEVAAEATRITKAAAAARIAEAKRIAAQHAASDDYDDADIGSDSERTKKNKAKRQKA